MRFTFKAILGLTFAVKTKTGKLFFRKVILMESKILKGSSFSVLNFSILTDRKLPMLKFFFNREHALGNYIQTPYNVVDSANGIPVSYVSLELYLLSLLPKES